MRSSPSGFGIGGRFGYFIDRKQDRPIGPFTVFAAPGTPRVVIPPRLYTWYERAAEYYSNPSAAVSAGIRYTTGDFYDGDLQRVALDVKVRVGAKFSTAISYDLDAIPRSTRRPRCWDGRSS